MELVRRAGKPFLFVLCQAKPQASITAQAVAALSEHGRVARSFIVDRVAYAAAMTSGNTRVFRSWRIPSLPAAVSAQ
jgi:chromosome partitioning protein